MSLVAKPYVKALLEGTDTETKKNICSIFVGLSAAFNEPKFNDVMDSPTVSRADKESLLLSAVEKAKSEKINNFIKLLVEKNRINVIPAIANELEMAISIATNEYDGVIYSDTEMDSASVKALSEGLSKKVGSSITLEFVKNDFDGVKIEVEGLGVEVNFSKSRINNQIIDHILKAI